jgi:hypothetical protein
MNGRYLLAIALGLGAADASAQILMRIPHQSEPYVATIGAGDTSVPLKLTGRPPGAKAPGVLWNYEHRTADGWNNRNYMRFFWWDYDVSQFDGGDGQAGWYVVGKTMRPGAEWPDVPYYLRFRVRVNTPILPHSGSSAQMKWFIFGFDHPESAGGGHVRNITSFYPGSATGGDDRNTTTIELDAGISQAFNCAARIQNFRWTHIQTAWRWGPKGTAYQRIYVDNNDINRPNAENRTFTSTLSDGAWHFPGMTLDNQVFWGNIISSRSRVREDAQIDIMDMELSTSFDAGWAPGAGARGAGDERRDGSRADCALLLAAAGGLILTLKHGPGSTAAARAEAVCRTCD